MVSLGYGIRSASGVKVIPFGAATVHGPSVAGPPESPETPSGAICFGRLRQFGASEDARSGIAGLDQTVAGKSQSEFSRIGQHRDPESLPFGYCYLVVAGSSQAAPIKLPKTGLRMNRRRHIS